VKEAPKNMVRVDASQQKIDHMVLKSSPVVSVGMKRVSSSPSTFESPSIKQVSKDDPEGTKETISQCGAKEKVEKREIKLTSLANLRKRVQETANIGKSKIL